MGNFSTEILCNHMTSNSCGLMNKFDIRSVEFKCENGHWICVSKYDPAFDFISFDTLLIDILMLTISLNILFMRNASQIVFHYSKIYSYL